VRPILTHLALGVRDLDRTIAFYRKHPRLHVVHERADGGMRVVWLADRERDPDFVLVLLPLAGEPAPGPRTLQHLGFAVASRGEVDEAAAAGRADGVLRLEPADGGPIVGYFCILEDPDGNQVEFSHGQPINPRDLPAASRDPVANRSRAAGEGSRADLHRR
jgi:catechol 2,3-dioxygenase-like lactoylglutathione lyase family enzyme